MKQVTNEAPKQKLMDKLIDFLSRSRKPIMISLGLIAVVVVTLVIVLSVQNSRNEAALAAAEDLQSSFDDWMEIDDEEKPDGYDELSQAAAEIVDGYPRTYAAARARMIDARALVELERWDEAAAKYSEIADFFPESYLAPTALMDAAVAAESGGDTDRTLELLNRAASYRRLIDDYPASSWTNLARNRIITLTVEGRIGG